jgi:outer membrane protein OmpA-like peptidoglycan-associated protein
MNHQTLIAAAVLAVSLPLAATAAPKPLADHANCAGKDTTLFTRMPGFFLAFPSYCQQRQFDRFEFTVAQRQKTGVEGAWAHYRYAFDKTLGTPPGALQIVRNYQNAAKAAGGEVVYEDLRTHLTTLRIVKGDKEIWAQVGAVSNEYNLYVVEKQAMKQEVTANADAMNAGLASTGHVEVPGIFFDTGKSDLKPESEAALAEVVKLLQQSASLKVWVVGHTDFVGSPESNLALSNARAAAVVKALVQKGIAPARLGSFGAGPYAPVATNADETGRAKNRRVELVARQ